MALPYLYAIPEVTLFLSGSIAFPNWNSEVMII
jgi:hypothetical protein